MTASIAGENGQRGRGTNLPRVADFNESVVLNSIRRSESGRSRVELTAETGLSAQTVSNIVRRLIEQRLIVEAGKQSSGFGKPRTMLELDPTGCYAVGVHIDPAVITYVLLDFAGAVVAHASQRTPSVRDPQPVLSEISDRIDKLVAQSGVKRSRVLGVGIASPGPVDVVRGLVLDPPHLPEWHRVPLRDHLREATGLPVLLDKDVIAGAVAEQWASGSAGSHNFVFFYMGTGVGAGFVIDDVVIRGVSSNAGDIGILPVTDGDFSDRYEGGTFSALWQVGSPEMLVAEAIDKGAIEGGFALTDAAAVDAAFDQLCVLADKDDERAQAILERSARHVASAVVTITNMLDVDTVVFGGAMWERVAPRYLDRIDAIVSSHSVSRNLHRIRLVGTALGSDVAAIGAACLVLDNKFSPRPATLLLAP